MKKFSNISGFKVTQEPKIDGKKVEIDPLKGKVMELMDQLLSIRTYGPVDRHQRAGLIKIAGKELLAEALLDLLKKEKGSEGIKILESLKQEIGDWKVIDEKINEIKNHRVPSLKNKNKMRSILEKYNDLELLEYFLGDNSKKITNIETLEDYKYLVSESRLPTEVKIKLIQIFETRLGDLNSL